MNTSPQVKRGWFDRACRHNGLSRGVGVVLLLVPVLSLLGFGLPFGSPQTRPIARELLKEGNVVEWVGFAGFFLGGLYGLYLSNRLRKLGETKSLVRFYFIVSLVFIFLAMEEISWGQRAFGFNAPEVLRSINEQKETNFHNLPIIQDLNEWFLITVGVIGFIASTFQVQAKHWKRTVPPLLGFWFILLAFMVALDIGPWHHWLPEEMDFAVGWLIEVNETLLGIACLLWMVLNARILRGGAAAREPQGAASAR